MPSTKELINYMKIQASGWNRRGEKGLLEVLDQAQDILYKQELAQTIAYRTDGELPYVATTEDVHEYTLDQATTGIDQDIWRVGAVLVKPPYSNEFINSIRSEYGITPNLIHSVHSMTINGREYYRFLQTANDDSLRNGHPLLKFSINPGTTTQDFYLLAYKKPTKLTSENIRPSLPETLHITCLLPAAMKLVEGYQNGNFIEALAMIEERYKPMVMCEMNKGAQGVEDSVTRIEA